MSYYFSKELPGVSLKEAIEKVKLSFSKEGFGVQMELDVQKTIKEKINEDIRNYVILGVCNPRYAFMAISLEEKIGLFLPCNVLVEENKNGNIEVSVVDPFASMMAVKNDDLGSVAAEVRQKLQNAINDIK